MSRRVPQVTAMSAVIFIIFLGSIDSSFGLNCNDGSIETLNRCRALVDSGLTQRPVKFPMNEGCILPDIPNSDVVLESNRKLVLVSGETVPHLSLISYECSSGYLLVGSRYNLCYNGEWYSKAHLICIIPTHPCPNRFKSYYGIEVACNRNGLMVSCDDPIVPGTVARIRCLNRYEKKIESGSDSLVCQENGTWNNEIISCFAVCGELVTRSTPFNKNGIFTDVTFVPWHVAIYKKESGNYSYHCGGTIISEHEIVTAASCFLKPDAEDIEDKSLFLVGAGKHLGDYNANDPKTQFRTVLDIIIDTVSSEAIIHLTDCLTFTSLIGPVCLGDLDDDKGNLVNYGREEKNGRITRDTRLIPLSHENWSIDCASIRVNEICATDQCVGILCRNFLGSGFTVEVNKNGINRHYLVGIANVTQKIIKILPRV